MCVSRDPVSSESSRSMLSTGHMGRTNGKEVATVARLMSMDVNEGSWSSLASSWGSSKKSGFSGLALCGMLSVRELLARSAKQFRFRLVTGTRGTCRLSKVSVGSRAEEDIASVGSHAEDVVGQGFGQWDASLSPCGFGPQSLKLWSTHKVKVETVKDQSSHSIKVNHRGLGSRLKSVKANYKSRGQGSRGAHVQGVKAVAIGPAGVSYCVAQWLEWEHVPVEMALTGGLGFNPQFWPFLSSLGACGNFLRMTQICELGIPMAVDFVLCHIWK
ncbi:hypothetical protein B0F90DRAFT_1920014 [Multifurca ochricompacta]|uniref:Uncharacterized protein n=1 Tax=Multifurca ochricompacta TaxID=376703 RepID=A0AAD4QIW3_9AGAM|nr:hypothetical protein B0F90DRAFT_1920014 [Multifurca ochricompacta]